MNPDQKLIEPAYEDAIKGLYNKLFEGYVEAGGVAAQEQQADQNFAAGVTLARRSRLEGDVKALHSDQRAALTDSLLQSLNAGRLPVRWERQLRYHLLCHKALSAQLRPFIAKGDFQTRLAAIGIAGACARADLGQLLLKIAVDVNEVAAIRIEAASAVADLGENSLIAGLFPLAVNAALDDENSELKGLALDRLWKKRLIAAKDTFSHLTPASAAFHGAYDRFLTDLPDNLTRDDLPAAFTWIEAQPGWAEQSQSFQALTDRILAKAVNHASQPQTMTSLINVIRSGIQKNRLTGWSHGESTFKDAIRLSADAFRQELIERFADALNAADFNGVTPSFPIRDFIGRILKVGDFEWLFSRCLAEPDQVKKRFFAHSARLVWDSSDATAYDAALEAHRTDPAVAEAFSGDFGYILLDSEAARRGRELFAEPLAAPTRDRSQIDADIEKLLDQIEGGDIEAWWRLALILTWSNSVTGQSEWVDDVRQLSGWELSMPMRRNRLLNAAQLYILRGAQTGEDWERSDARRPAAAAYRALLLLQNERPEFFATIPARIFSSWTSAILSYPTIALANNMREADKVIVEGAVSADTAAATAVLKTLVDEPEHRGRLRDQLRRLDGLAVGSVGSFFEQSSKRTTGRPNN